MHSKLVYLFTLCLSTLSSAHATEETISFIRARQIDFVVGGGIETITLKITAKSFNSPFHWSVSIANNTGTLFSAYRDDTWLDGFFGDDGYIEGCKGYAECKKKWYFNDLVASVLGAGTSVGSSMKRREDWELISLDNNSQQYLLEKGLPVDRIKQIQTEMKMSLSSGFSQFVIPISPVQDDSIYMYVKSLNYFVPYWND